MAKVISDAVLAVLKAIDTAGKPLSNTGIAASLGCEDIKTRATVYNLANRGQLRVKGKDEQGKKCYELTKEGRAILNNLADYQVVPVASRRTGSGRKKGSTNKKTKALPDVIPIDVPLSFSTSATNLMDNINQVFQENAHYREAILKAASQLAHYVGMKLVPINDSAEPQ